MSHRKYRTDKEGYGLRHSTGLEVCGIGEDMLCKAVQVAFAALGWDFARSVLMDEDGALVSPIECVIHNPLIAPGTRGTATPWDSVESALVLSDWLMGRRLPSTLPPTKNVDGYEFLGHAGAIWPPGPRMVDGAPNEARLPEYIYKKGWQLSAGLSEGWLVDTLSVIPIWVRWGPFDGDMSAGRRLLENVGLWSGSERQAKVELEK